MRARRNGEMVRRRSSNFFGRGIEFDSRRGQRGRSNLSKTRERGRGGEQLEDRRPSERILPEERARSSKKRRRRRGSFQPSAKCARIPRGFFAREADRWALLPRKARMYIRASRRSLHDRARTLAVSRSIHSFVESSRARARATPSTTMTVLKILKPSRALLDDHTLWDPNKNESEILFFQRPLN